MKKTNILIIGIIGIILISSVLFAFIYLQKSSNNERNKNFQIIYSVSNGESGRSDTLTINNDGSVILEEQQYLEQDEKTRTVQLSDKEIQELKSLIDSANVFEFEDKYSCESDINTICAADASSINLKFLINNEEKIIYMYFPETLPEDLEEILNELQIIKQKFN